MQFSFVYKQRACCGGGGSGTVLTSSSYNLLPQNIQGSVIIALDSFNKTYNTQPTGIIVSSNELALLKSNLPSSEFAIRNGAMYYRSLKLTVKD